MSNLYVEGGHCFFKLFKGGHLQKSLGNPALDCLLSQWHCQSFISRGENFSISPSNIPDLRKEMVAKIFLGFLFS